MATLDQMMDFPIELMLWGIAPAILIIVTIIMEKHHDK